MRSRPYVVINVAASADGKLDTFERHGAAISSDRDRLRVDALRASVDAVMVGSHTAIDEDPRLTVKSPDLRADRRARGQPDNPAKVAVVAHLRLPLASRFLTAGPARIILFTPALRGSSATTIQKESADAAASETTNRHAESVDAADLAEGTHQEGGSDGADAGWAALVDRGVEIFALGRGRVDLTAAMGKLFELGIKRVLVEGGGTLNFELLRRGLVDEVQIFVAPVMFGGATSPTLADGIGLASAAAVPLERTDVEVWDDGGVLLRYKVAPRQ